MFNHGWVIEVLEDVLEYARRNELEVVAQSIDDALMTILASRPELEQLSPMQ